MHDSSEPSTDPRSNSPDTASSAGLPSRVAVDRLPSSVQAPASVSVIDDHRSTTLLAPQARSFGSPSDGSLLQPPSRTANSAFRYQLSERRPACRHMLQAAYGSWPGGLAHSKPFRGMQASHFWLRLGLGRSVGPNTRERALASTSRPSVEQALVSPHKAKTLHLGFASADLSICAGLPHAA